MNKRLPLLIKSGKYAQNDEKYFRSKQDAHVQTYRVVRSHDGTSLPSKRLGIFDLRHKYKEGNKKTIIHTL